MSKTRPPLPSAPADETCPVCGWSLLTSGMTREAHDVVCEGLKEAKPKPPPEP